MTTTEEKTTGHTAPVVAGIDAGGTSWKLVIATGPDNILARHRVPTTTPEETVSATVDWLKHVGGHHGLDAVGLASFGPIDRDPASPDWGMMLDTPKPGWSGANARLALEEALGLPCTLETDVNAALKSEMAWGAARGCRDAVYITIGTGVGGAIAVDHKIAGTPYHPEIGHIRTPYPPIEGSDFSGTCPFHGDCIEGMIAAPAFRQRWGCEPEDLPDGHPAWRHASIVLAELCAAITYMVAPQIVILGGGIMLRDGLIADVRDHYQALTRNYGLRPEAREPESYIVTPGLGNDAGALGGVLIALDRLR